jgi:hypothetical protein
LIVVALAGCGVLMGPETTYLASETSIDAKSNQGSSTITGVQVAARKQIVLRGRSTMPDGTCLGTELWVECELQTW